MNEAPEVEVVELGDAKEQTKGWLLREAVEVHPTLQTKDPIGP